MGRQAEVDTDMKSFANTSFFRLFDRVVRPSDPLTPERSWTRNGVDWTHVRHTFNGVDHGFSVDVFTGVKAGKQGWSILVVREGWWMGRKGDPTRTTQWAHVTSGSRADAMSWFQAQESFSAR